MSEKSIICTRCLGTGDADDNGWRGDCPYFLAGGNGNNGTTTCSYGCYDEPECQTCCPGIEPDGWGPDPGPTCWDCNGVGVTPMIRGVDVGPWHPVAP